MGGHAENVVEFGSASTSPITLVVLIRTKPRPRLRLGELCAAAGHDPQATRGDTKVRVHTQITRTLERRIRQQVTVTSEARGQPVINGNGIRRAALAEAATGIEDGECR
jgi:hypothetical protein